MNMFARIAAALCFLAVALGAFGAHALKSKLEDHGMTDVWNKAVLYHFIHALMLFILATRPAALGFAKGPWICFVVGILIFSGSLYLLAVTNVRWLGAITPIGGISFIAGWAWLLICGGGKSSN